MSDTDKVFSVIGVATLAFVGITLSALFTAFTLQTLWVWFVIPLNVPPIGLAHAYGLALIASVLVHRLDTSTKEDQGMFVNLIIRFLFNVILIIMGAIAHHFMVS